MEVRTASLNDLDAIESLWKEMMLFHIALDETFAEIPEAEAIHHEYMKGLSLDESERVLVTDDDCNILGFIVMKVCENPPIYPLKEYVEIAAISIRKSARRKGIGHQLVKGTLGWCCDQGFSRVECAVAVKNPVAQGIRRRWGSAELLNGVCWISDEHRGDLRFGVKLGYE